MASIEIHKMRIRPRLLALTFLLPSNIAFLFAVAILILFAGSRRKTIVPKFISTGVILISFFLISTFIGVYAGIDEAQRYLIRSFVFLILFILVAVSFDYRTENTLNDFLKGVLAVALVNSIAVIIFALYPEIYHSLGINNFSGYDKGVRFLRSPGLLRGTDNAGYLSAVGLLIAFYFREKNIHAVLSHNLLLMILLLAPLFSSRSSMILIGLSSLISVFYFSRAMHPITKFFVVIISSVILIVGVYLIFIMFAGSSDNAFIFHLPFLGSNLAVDQIYSIGKSEAYTIQYSFLDNWRVIPLSGIGLSDNLYMRTLMSLGSLSFSMLLILMGWFFYSILSNSHTRQRGLNVSLVLVLVFINLKNNYFFFVPYSLLLFFLLSNITRHGSQDDLPPKNRTSSVVNST